jgi:osomolarity two-component system, sensor histidine kinase NIK1
MGGEEDPFFAAAAILRNLAREPPPSDDDDDTSLSPKQQVKNGFDSKRVVRLPGENTAGKKAFTTELESLVSRIHDLETELVSHPNPLISLTISAFTLLCHLLCFLFTVLI